MDKLRVQLLLHPGNCEFSTGSESRIRFPICTGNSWESYVKPTEKALVSPIKTDPPKIVA